MSDGTKATTIQKKKVGHYDNLFFYRVDEDALRREIELHAAKASLDMNYSKTNARGGVSARAELEISEEFARDLRLIGDSRRFVTKMDDGRLIIVGYGRVGDSVDFRGIPKDDMDARQRKAEDMMEEIDTPDARRSVEEEAVANVIERVTQAVEHYNAETRRTFVQSTGNVAGWGDDDAGEDEEMLREEADKIRERIRELEKTAARMERAALEKKRERVLAALDEAEEEEAFGDIPAEWLEDAREAARSFKPHTPRGALIPA